MTELHERPGGGWSLRGVQKGEGVPEGTVDLGSYEAVVLSDAMAGNSGAKNMPRGISNGTMLGFHPNLPLTPSPELKTVMHAFMTCTQAWTHKGLHATIFLVQPKRSS